MSDIYSIDDTFTELDRVTISGTAQDLDGTVINITGATIELIYWFGRKPPAKVSGSIVSGTAGTFNAKFSSGIPDYGELHFVWRLTESGGDIFHSTREYVVKVRQRLRQVA